MQKQCNWCGKLGARVGEGELREPHAQPHADGSRCVCRHVTAGTRLGALDASGRYWDEGARKWLCFACGTTRRIALDDVRMRERGAAHAN